jgi:DNA invertase Pin-like site-specific DNA recombinase
VKRTALYARVSTKGQADNYSFAMQEADCEAYAKRQADAMDITVRFVEVKSGRTLDRDELTKLLTLIKNREIDAVIVGKLDRLSRNVAQLATIAETCREYDVELHYADFGKDEDTPMGRMIRNMRGSYAEFEADIIYERTQGGRNEAMKSRVLGAAPRAPYGHIFIGRGKDKKLVVNEDEADTIRQIRDWLLQEGLGTPSIAAKLTRLSITPPGAAIWRNTQWSAAGVYRILTDHSIAGTYYHGRYRRAKRGDKYPRPTDPSEWTAIECDPIISTEEFAAIQKKLIMNKELSKRNSKRFYLLGRRIKCKCGLSLTGDSHGAPPRRTYRCIGSKSVAVRKCKPMVQVNADLIEQFTWNWLVTQLEPENLKAGLIAEQKRAAETIAELERQISIQHKQEKELNGRLARIQQGFNCGFYTLEEAIAQKAQIEPSIRSVKEELERLQDLLGQADRSEQDDAALMAEAEELYEEARNVTDEQRKRWFIDRLNLRVMIERDGKDCWATLSCILGTTRDKVSSANISMKFSAP